jgi:thienamycin biosynthesis protein ThnN
MPALLEFTTRYFREFLPNKLTPADHEEFRKIGVPVALVLRAGSEEERWCLLETSDGLQILSESSPAECTFKMSTGVFELLITGQRSPQRAFFAGEIAIDGSKLLALRVASLLEGIFRRIPFRESPESIGPRLVACAVPGGVSRPLGEWHRLILRLHLDPSMGAPYWLERARELAIRVEELHTFEDLLRFGEFDREAAAARPYRDFIPRHVLAESPRLILGETGGTTGAPLTSAWQHAEFATAFIDPLVNLLESRRVTSLRQWLFVGPTGPHIIGKAAEALAVATTNTDALRVDFDPRWHRKLVPGSFAATRHLEHLVEQTRTLLLREEIDALFITPSVLTRLLSEEAEALHNLRLVHLGGQSIGPEETTRLRAALPNGAMLINGYGNSLFGCIVEEEEAVTYRFPEDRYELRLCAPGDFAREVNAGETGQVVSYRFDETTMLLNVVERDEADHRGDLFHHPRPIRDAQHLVSGGIY